MAIDVDLQCSPELIEAANEAEVEAAAIRGEFEKIDQERARFLETVPEEFDFSGKINRSLRERLGNNLVRELKHRKGIAEIDAAHRRELAQLRSERAIPELRDARKNLSAGLVALGFPPAAEPGDADPVKIMVSKLIDQHPKVAAAGSRAAELLSKSNSGEFRQQNDAEIEALKVRIREHQEAAVRV
jgi:hypothetical protein